MIRFNEKRNLQKHFVLILLCIVGIVGLTNSQGFAQKGEASLSADDIIWTRFIIDYANFYDFAKIYIKITTNDTQWQQWVQKEYPVIARRINATVRLIGDWTSIHSSTDKALVIVPMWDEHQAHLLSKALSFISAESVWWLVMTSNLSFTELQNHVYFPLLNQATIAFQENQAVTLQEIHQIQEHAEQRVAPVGAWKLQGDGTSSQMNAPVEDVVSRRTDLTGVHFRCLSLTSKPAVVTEKLPDETLSITGWMGDIWKEMQKISNFTYECKEPRDGEWGVRDCHGNWTGMVGELVSNQSDIIISNLDHTEDRDSVIDFCKGMGTSWYEIVMRRPSKFAHWEAFTRAFKWKSWLLVLVVFCLAILTIYFINKLAPREENHAEDTSDIVFWTFGAFCDQNYTADTLNTTSKKIATVTVYLCAMLLFAFYTSSIISDLTVENDDLPFKSMEELYEQRRSYSFGFVRGYAVEEKFKFQSATSTTYNKVWYDMVPGAKVGDRHHCQTNELRRDSLVKNEAEGIKRACETGTYVHFMYEPEFHYISPTGDCDIVKLPQKFVQSNYAFALRKGSQYTRIISYLWLKLRDGGVYHRFAGHWQQRNEITDPLKNQAISPANLVFLYVMLVVKAVLALLVLGTEFIFSKYPGNSSILGEGEGENDDVPSNTDTLSLVKVIYWPIINELVIRSTNQDMRSENSSGIDSCSTELPGTPSYREGSNDDTDILRQRTPEQRKRYF